MTIRGDSGIGTNETIFLRVHQLKYGKTQYTDTANATRLIDICGEDIRYNSKWKKWLVWNGKRWEMDEGHLMDEKGMEVIHSIYDDLLDTSDSRDWVEIEKEGLKAESLRRRNAVIELASRRKEVHIATDDVDRDPFLLNVKNGTVNLKTGELQEHNKTDLITKMADVDFDPDAKCPLWKNFVREIMDSKVDLIVFLQAAAGWAVTGDTSEQCMFMLYGSGANGKSTFLNVIMKILGDYAVSASTETFMKKQGDNMSNDIARLRGTRFVTTIEAEQGRRLSEPLIKQITGNDVMTARFLYGEFFEFKPNCKIFMATNHKPIIKGTDHGIWRRIKMIPFTTTIAPDKRDKHLEEKLLAEAPGILNWLIEGAKFWCEYGLPESVVIDAATDEYRNEMDVIGSFIKENCIHSPDRRIAARKLYTAYKDSASAAGAHPFSEKVFSQRLKAMGIENARTNKGNVWKGIDLIDEDT